ncbi:unnamed protein product [Debaryomyces fabryi]|nr:unnamed protein product [Debaryomyces fabryi]
MLKISLISRLKPSLITLNFRYDNCAFSAGSGFSLRNFSTACIINEPHLTIPKVYQQYLFRRNMSTKHDSDKQSHSHGNIGGDSKHHQGNEHSHEHSLLGHSHSHSRHQPNEFLSVNTDTIKHNPAVRITWIGLLVNVAMAVSKGVGGVYFHSQSLIADAIHSISDMFADFLTLATVNVAQKVGSPTHYPLGYGKVETIGSVLVSGVLLFAGVSVGWSSLLQVFEFALPAYMFEYVSMIQIGHSHSHAGLGGEVDSHGHGHSHMSGGAPDSSIVPTSRPIPNINAAWLAGGSVIVKELLYRKTMKIAVETNSKVLVANAWHHRVDSLTAVVALLTVAGGNIFNVAWLDSIGGLCVSVLIIKAGWDSFKTSIFELIDKGEDVESEVFSKVHDIVTEEIKNVANNEFKIDKLSVLNSGAITNIYMTLSTSKEFRLKELNQIESNLVTAIKADYEFVRNIFILFKDSEQQKISQERSTESSHEHTK